MMHTVMTTNGGFDSILVVDEDDKVVSKWMATRDDVLTYLRDGQDADEWDTNSPEYTAITDYGTECGRDGVITDERRAEFWGVPTQLTFRAIFQDGRLAVGVTSTSKALLRGAVRQAGISLADVQIVPGV